MNYNNKNVRRQDRLLDEVRAIELLHSGEYGMISMVEIRNGETAGYGIPFSYVWDGKDSIYFHCAPEGHKSNSLAQNQNVSFCVVGNTNVISDKFTTNYESIVLRGKMCTHISSEERMTALLLILDKYSPDDKEAGIKYAEKSFQKVNIIRLDIEEFSGKKR